MVRKSAAGGVMLKQILNACRNIWLFNIRYPWVKHGRHIHCQLSTRFGVRRRYNIVIGDYVGIGLNCLFQTDTEIGRKVLIASNVAFVNRHDHLTHLVGRTMWDSGQGDRYNIVVEDDVWIGHGCIILGGTRIGRGAIVAAASVITKDVPRYAIVGGNPANLIRMRFTPEQIDEHEKLLVVSGETRKD